MDTITDRPDAPRDFDEVVAHDTHGQSIAAWTAVGVMLIGAFVAAAVAIAAAAGYMDWNPFLFWLGMLVMAVVGPAVGIVMSKMGYGAGGAKDSFTNSHY